MATACPELLFARAIEGLPLDRAKQRVANLKRSMKIYGARAVGWQPFERRKKKRRMRHQTVVGMYLGQVYESGESLIYSNGKVSAHSRVKVFEDEIVNRDLLAALSASAVAEVSTHHHQRLGAVKGDGEKQRGGSDKGTG